MKPHLSSSHFTAINNVQNVLPVPEAVQEEHDKQLLSAFFKPVIANDKNFSCNDFLPTPYFFQLSGSREEWSMTR